MFGVFFKNASFRNYGDISTIAAIFLALLSMCIYRDVATWFVYCGYLVERDFDSYWWYTRLLPSISVEGCTLVLFIFILYMYNYSGTSI